MSRRRRTGLCVCGSRDPYLRCCGRFLSGAEQPATPELLMRSRYAAYALGDAGYIIETTDPDGPCFESDRDAWEQSVLEFSRTCDFEGVAVHSTSVEPETGRVHFTARLRRKREDVSFEEHSVFVLRDGRWLYHSAD